MTAHRPYLELLLSVECVLGTHFIVQILWDNFLQKTQCSYLNIAGTLDPLHPLASGAAGEPAQLRSLEQQARLFTGISTARGEIILPSLL